MGTPAYPYSKGGVIGRCDITIKVAGKDWIWRCWTCGAQGEPADPINAYWDVLVHEKERENND